MKIKMAMAAVVAAGMAFSVNSAMAADGEAVFKKRCTTCHTSEAGKHKSGPSLVGIFGKQAGTVEGFKYKSRSGLLETDWSWDEANLDAYLTNPTAFVKEKGRKKSLMSFKLKKDADRAAVIEYLKGL